jgi:sec-independent protein translocase protein TatA
MFGLGTPELIVILGIAFLVFGGKKLPELGAGLGKGIRSFKNGLREVEESGKKTLEENVPGVIEVNALKEEVDKVKDFGKVLSGKKV